jgi:hypothetical protein
VVPDAGVREFGTEIRELIENGIRVELAAQASQENLVVSTAEDE